jgi:hypothetical protein
MTDGYADMRDLEDDRLDDLLNAWRLEPPSAALRDAVMAAAPGPRTAGFRLPFAGARLWLAGAGLAAGLAGLSCGAAFASVAARDARDEALVAAAAPGSASILPLPETAPGP